MQQQCIFCQLFLIKEIKVILLAYMINIQSINNQLLMQVETKFVSKLVKETLSQIILKAFPTVKGDVLLQNGPKNQFQYVSPTAMKQFNMNKNKKQGTSLGCKTVNEFSNKIVQSFFVNDYIQSIQANDKGFLQIKVKDTFIEQGINQIVNDLKFPEVQKQKIVVDFSSPNIAKQMHVGHLRSTIIGESTCRILQYMGHQVIRANHVGDWGTQFGMLIAYMKQQFPDYNQKMPEIKDLDDYYKAARKRFDSNPEFKKLSQETVVQLQAYDQSCIKAWKMICEISRAYFTHIYKRLNITLQQFGQSYYNPFIPATLQQVTNLGLVKQDDTVMKKGVKVQKKAKIQQKQEVEEQQISLQQGNKKKAKCIFIQKYPNPLIVVKSDGGYNYDTTDLACIRYRLMNLKVDRAIYITDLGQRQHFQMIFAAAKKAGWLTNQRVQHMGFGVVLGEDGKKFSTRKGVAVKLLDLLNQAKDNALIQLKSRQKDQTLDEGEQKKQAVYTSLKPEQYEDAAQKLGIASIKYYDLRQNRGSDYIFDFKKMLDPKGNTAIYLIYAYVRMCSIIRKSGLTSQQIQELAKKKPFVITHPDERILAGMLIKFFDVMNQATDDLSLNKITDFIYEICVKVQENYKKYRIIGDEHMESRIILCEAIRKVLEKSFFMVGIVPIEKI